VDATSRFAEIVSAPEPEIALDEAALVIAAHAHPGLDVTARLRELDALATTTRARDAAELATALFGDGGFAGNTTDYGDPANSYLDDVLDRRLGIPITLSVLMIEVGRRVGVPLRGVGMPGHFLVDAGAGEWYDPFHRGARLDIAGCADRFAETQVRASFRPQFLAPVGPRRILERILTNLQHSLLQREPSAAAWPTRLRLRIPGITVGCRGELAALLGNLGQFSEAARELDALARELPGEAGQRAAKAAARFRARTN